MLSAEYGGSIFSETALDEVSWIRVGVHTARQETRRIDSYFNKCQADHASTLERAAQTIAFSPVRRGDGDGNKRTFVVVNGCVQSSADDLVRCLHQERLRIDVTHLAGSVRPRGFGTRNKPNPAWASPDVRIVATIRGFGLWLGTGPEEQVVTCGESPRIFSVVQHCSLSSSNPRYHHSSE